MRLELVEAKPFHCGQMARRLRAEHRNLLANMHVPTHRELRSAFDASVVRCAWLFDGELGAIAGVTGTLASPEGVLWLAMTDAAAQHPHHIARGALRFMKTVSATKSRISTTVLAKDRPSVQFAYFLGFRVEARGEIGGAPVIAMAFSERKAA